MIAVQAHLLQTLLPDLQVHQVCQMELHMLTTGAMLIIGLVDSMALQFQQMQPPWRSVEVIQLCRSRMQEWCKMQCASKGKHQACLSRSKLAPASCFNRWLCNVLVFCRKRLAVQFPAHSQPSH